MEKANLRTIVGTAAGFSYAAGEAIQRLHLPTEGHGQMLDSTAHFLNNNLSSGAGAYALMNLPFLLHALNDKTEWKLYVHDVGLEEHRQSYNRRVAVASVAAPVALLYNEFTSPAGPDAVDGGLAIVAAAAFYALGRSSKKDLKLPARYRTALNDISLRMAY